MVSPPVKVNEPVFYNLTENNLGLSLLALHLRIKSTLPVILETRNSKLGDLLLFVWVI